MTVDAKYVDSLFALVFHRLADIDGRLQLVESYLADVHRSATLDEYSRRKYPIPSEPEMTLERASDVTLDFWRNASLGRHG